MGINVTIPSPLRKLTGGQGKVTADGGTVMEILDNLEVNFPGIRERIIDENAQLRRFINIFLNWEDIRFLQGLETSVKDSDEISIVPAIAGG